jgi:hypothetical protein
MSALAPGATVMGYALASLFFLKFWRRTRDGLFLAFSGAFLLMAATPCLTAILAIPKEEQSPFYLLRLAAYLLIIGAIVAKSVKGRQRPDRQG